MNQYIKYYQKEYEARRISRREFAGRLGAAGVAATTATSLLTASDSVLADTPVKGGRMRIGWYTHSANDTLDTTRMKVSLDYLRVYQLSSQLVRYTPKVTLEPDLATEWDSDDLKTWRFKLRKGVEFHNGKSLTVQDCIYSLNRHRGENSQSPIKQFMDTITELKADGDWLVVDIEAPNADFPMYLGMYQSNIVPDGFEDFDNLVGTGPFILDSFRPGIGMLAKRNPNYHHEGYPHVDEVESFGIGDTAARVNALLAGDIHFTTRVDPKSIPIIEGAPNTAMANTPSSRHLTFPMVSDRPPTDNRDFRQAMRLLVDRKAVVDNIQKGYGMMGNDIPISPADLYYCPEIPQRDIDLDKAKFHLKKAEMDGGTIDLRTSESAGGVQSIDIAHVSPRIYVSQAPTFPGSSGTRHSGRTRDSTSSSRWREASRTVRNAGRSTARRSRSCGTRAAPSSRCLPIGSMHAPRSSAATASTQSARATTTASTSGDI